MDIPLLFNVFSDIPRRDFKLAKVRGLAVLVTCDYDGQLDTKNDAIEMRKTFEHFGYEIVELRNNKATYGEITKLMKQISQYLRKYNGPINDKVLIFAFSGHGASRDRIIPYGCCAWKLSLRKDILPHFVENRHLLSIPKLFFIDACRGGGEIKGEKDTFQKYLGEYVPKGLLQNEGNFRIDFATIPGHVAHVNSWMWHLAQDIRKESPQKSIQYIAVNVRSKVPTYQIPEAIDRLAAPFHFRR